MIPNSHFSDLLSAFERNGVSYWIVGGYAVMRYSEPRYTKDLDLWVKPEAENSQRVFRSLAEFGAPLGGVSAGDFAKEDLIYQLGVPPIRVDIVTSLSGLEFSSAWERRTESEFGGVRARFIGLDDLLTNKRSVGRLADLLDCERLEESRSRE